MSDYLSCMTVEERTNGDPLDHLIWSGLTLHGGALPPMDVPGMRFLVPEPWSESRRRAFSGVARQVVHSLSSRLDEVCLDPDQVLVVEQGPKGRLRWRPWQADQVRDVASAYGDIRPLTVRYAHAHARTESDHAPPRAERPLNEALTRDFVSTASEHSSFFMVQFKTDHASAPPPERLDDLRKLITSVSQTLDLLISGGTAAVHNAIHTDEVVILDTESADPAARRAAFLARGWPTATELAVRLGSTSDNPAQYTSRLRRAKKLFGVWSTQDGGTYVHPDFQFGEGGTLSPAMPELLTALEAIPGFSDRATDVGGGDPGRWRRLFWLYAPRSELSARSLAEAAQHAAGQDPLEALASTAAIDATPRAPAEVWREAPDAVIALARQDADQDRAGV